MPLPLLEFSPGLQIHTQPFFLSALALAAVCSKYCENLSNSGSLRPLEMRNVMGITLKMSFWILHQVTVTSNSIEAWTGTVAF